MKIIFLKRFDKSYSKLADKDQQAKAIEKFFLEPKPASLRIKKMEGQYGIFEMSANMDLRITFHFEKPDMIVFRNCGQHDITLKNA